MIISQCAESTATFRIIDTKLCVLIVTLSTKDNVKLAKQLSDGFEHSVYWNKYTLISNEEVTLNTNGIGNIKKPLDSIFKKLKYYLLLLITIVLVLMVLMQMIELKSTLAKSIFFKRGYRN